MKYTVVAFNETEICLFIVPVRSLIASFSFVARVLRWRQLNFINVLIRNSLLYMFHTNPQMFNNITLFFQSKFTVGVFVLLLPLKLNW